MSEEKVIKSGTDARIAQDEEELRQLEEERRKALNPDLEDETKEEPQEEPGKAEPNAIGNSQEEGNWKKRYSDLRSYVEKDLKPGFQNQINDLKRQVEAATKEKVQLPKSEEELEAWAQEYPDLHGVLLTLATKIAREQTKSLEDRIKEVDEDRKTAAKEKAEAQLLKKHSDLYELRDSEEFHEWIREQGGWVEQALYYNTDNWRDASNAIDLYKAHKGLLTNKADKAKSREKDDRDASRHVKAASKAEEPKADDGYILESWIDGLSTSEFEKHEATIMKAYRTGKIKWDKSGAAR